MSRSLQKTLDDLKDYQRKHAEWQTQQERLVSEQASHDTKLDQAIAFDVFTTRERDAAMGFGKTVSCSLNLTFKAHSPPRK